MTVLGTRPEIIRLSRVISLLDKFVDHKLVHTGQNYDYELNEIFFNDLGVRKPDYFMAVDTSTLGRVYGNILIKAEECQGYERGSIQVARYFYIADLVRPKAAHCW